MRPPPARPERRRKERRSSVVVSMVGSSGSGVGGGESGGLLDALADAGVGTAAAEVAGHGAVDVGIARLRVVGEEGGGGHDLAGLAVAALGDVGVAPGFLE